MYTKRFIDDDLLSRVSDWYQLGEVIGVKTNVMAYALKNRDAMQSRIKLGDRVVYKSAPILRFTQNRLRTLLDYLFENKIADKDAIIAYRKGVTATEVVRNVDHAKMFVSFDIRHYYDSVTLGHIQKCLMELGLSSLGAKLVGRYCVVRKDRNKDRATLQQGSPASPVLSNIVGHFVFDGPIEAWLKEKYPSLRCTYLRYCDNIALFVHDDPPDGFTEAFKAFTKETLKGNGFKTHKWACIADNHPVIHQKFLGMVINNEARAELSIVNKLRAVLFNCCLNGFNEEAHKFLELEGVVKTRGFVADELVEDKFIRFLRGHINYIKRINEKQGLVLSKLFKAARVISNAGMVDGDEKSRVIDAVKQYRKPESIERYISRINGCYGASA